MTAMRVALGLGSNLGDRQENLCNAGRRLLRTGALQNALWSSVHETAPVGGPPQGDFLNQVIVGSSELEPRALVALAKRIEAELGRSPGDRWGPRVIDIDVLAVGALIVDSPDLTIPHSELAERAFVLVPWAEIDPGFRVPRWDATVAELLDRLASVATSGKPR